MKKAILTLPSGWIEVICGPMFAGKSEEIIKKINRLKYANISYLVFKPGKDTRITKRLCSRDGRNIEAIEINNPFNIYEYVQKNSIDVVAIDEVQFFNNDIIEVVQALADNGINVIVSGLDRDFRGEPFGPIPNLLTVAEYVSKLTAICTICGSEATRTQRIIDGKPADYNSPIIMIGNNDFYTARCRHHHVVPNKPIQSSTSQFKLKLSTDEIKAKATKKIDE